jgi:uncharacterized protein
LVRNTFHLSQSELIDRRSKRRSIERGHLDFWVRRGRGSYHLENVEQLRGILQTTLRLTGLLDRGKRNALDLRLSTVDFEFPNLPPRFDGFTILHLSDLHIDGLDGLTDRLIALAGVTPADLCVLTGDYRFEVEGSCESVNREMRRLMPSVRCRHGSIGILGNHDFLEEVETMEELGVRMLLNAACRIDEGDESIWIIGLDDPHYYGCDDLRAALVEVPPESFKILLVHSPELDREAFTAGIDLYLCGHTHGGQICLPLLGPPIRNAGCSRRLTRGKWRLERMHGYTSRGAGASLLPVRFGCPPEITVITLRRARLQPAVSLKLSSK